MLYGKSLLELCKKKKNNNWRNEAYSESYYLPFIYSKEDLSPYSWARTVRNKQYRYTMYPMNKGEQLFDLYNDPDEQVNLVVNSKYMKSRQELRDRLLDLIITQDYPYAPRNLCKHGVW